MVFKKITYLLFMLVLLACAGEAKYDLTESVSEMEAPADDAAPAGNILEELPQELSKEEQEAYQLRAKQKFQDFCDYLKLISDKRITKDLHQHAQKMISELFIADTIQLSGNDSVFFSPSDSLNSISLKRLVNYPFKTLPGKLPLTIQTKKLEFSSPLQSDSSNIIHGSLSVTFTANQKTHHKTVDVFLMETSKQFGEQSEKTIEVKLGNIYE